jgi:hypothetical protein
MKRENLLKSVWGIGISLLLLIGCSPQAAPIPTGTPVPPVIMIFPLTETPVPPTQTSEPPTPTTAALAGKTFTGPLESGTITFTISADGLVLSLKDVSCAEGEGGGGYSKVSMEITLPATIPIENLAFKYGSDNMFMPGYGMELIGRFDSTLSASGTFKYLDDSKPMEPCTYGPYQWTATAP